jgi:hypothetical protein
MPASSSPPAVPTIPSAPATARIAAAYGTLERGSAFLARSLQARARAGQAAMSGAGGAKVVGNGLRELDRFLGLLLDAAADAVSNPEFDRQGFSRLSNVANKLDAFYRLAGLTGMAARDAERLRAIGRVRSCLHHCRGVVHDPSVWDDLRVATDIRSCAEYSKTPDRLTVSFAELAQICRFYAQVGSGLVATCSRNCTVP